MKFQVDIHYQTDSGQPSSARVVVEAGDEEHAFQLADVEVRKDKRRRILSVYAADASAI
jgi:hypothetical protein